jgi:hydroxymethylpyrimidine/phosphomethylpyrimidine kinase
MRWALNMCSSRVSRVTRLSARLTTEAGGHVCTDAGTGEAVDVLFDGKTFVHLRSRRTDTRNTHGTGCTLAAAIAAELSKGHGLRQAIQASY